MSAAPAAVSLDLVLAGLRHGRTIVLYDDVGEHEGDLVLAADHVTAEAIAFMAREARGLIRLALPAERCDALGLPPMPARNRSRLAGAFTVSVEARDGVTTGISAADRAQTIRVAADPASGAADLVRPGHVFPLRATPGGVLKRARNTEAAVELAELAGLVPAAVICQVLDDDGEVATRPELERFCARHGLALVAVSDVVAHRRRLGGHRARVLDVALDEFSRHGYHGATIAAIGRRAGISEAYVLALYRTKRELFRAVHEHAVVLTRAALDEAVALRRAAGSPRGRDAAARRLAAGGALRLQLQAALLRDAELRDAAVHELGRLVARPPIGLVTGLFADALGIALGLDDLVATEPVAA